MPTTSDYLTQLQQDREDLIDNLETQGIDDLTGNETFTELVPRVLDIGDGGTPRLPSGYQEVEYISSSGSQYINTGVINNLGVYVEAKIKYNNTGFYPCIIGSQNTANKSDDGSQAPIILYYNSTNYCLYAGFTSYRVQNLLIDTTMPQIIKSSTVDGNTFLEVDGIRETNSQNDGQTRGNKSLYLFAMNNGGSPSFYSNARIYYLQIYDDVNGTLIRDFVPCYRKEDDVIGMYDLVNDNFYTNGGSGTFTKGSDVGYYKLQDKTITITTNTTTEITADAGYDGLGKVTITTNIS